MASNIKDMTQGRPARLIFAFALPLMVGNVFQQLYIVVDTAVVGRFVGVEALASVGAADWPNWMVLGMVTGFAQGFCILISQRFGAGDMAGMRRNVSHTYALGLALAAVLTLAAHLAARPILTLLGTPDNVMGGAMTYLRISYSGIFVIMAYNVFSSVLRALGDSKSPLYAMIIAAAINVVLDLLFVAVFRLGVGSAALATILSQILCASLALGRLTRTGRSYRIRWHRVRFERVMLRQVVTLGIPSGVQNSVVSLANVIVQANINAFGSSTMAGCGAYSKIEGFAFLPITCFALALSTFVSQNIGAQRYDRVRAGIKFGLLCSPILAECIGVCIYVFSPVLVSAFNDHPEVIAFGVNYAHTVSLFYFLLAFSHCCAGIMRGMGRPIVPMTIMLSVWCALRITYITLTVRVIPSIQVVYWAYPLTWAISSALFVLCLTRMRFPPTPPKAEAVTHDTRSVSHEDH